MKVCVLADLHLFSTEIGGKWSEDSFEIFRGKILPKIEEENPDILIFLGDTLDPYSGRKIPNWLKGDEINLRFSDVLKQSGIKNIYVLKGNHDYDFPLKNLNEMGILHYIDNDWLIMEDIGFYFFTSRYPNTKKAISDIQNIPDPNTKVKKKILLMHENLSIRTNEKTKNIPRDVIRNLSGKFDMIFNGHQHSYEQIEYNTWCIPSSLPWRPWEENCDLFLEDEMKIMNTKQWGYNILDTDDYCPHSKWVDIGINIIVINQHFNEESTDKIKNRLIEISEKISKISPPEKTIIRIKLEGTLKEGEERIDIGIPEIEEKYFSHFYEGNREMIEIKDLRCGGNYLDRDELRNMTILQALKELEPKIPGTIKFYFEIYDLMEKKTFDWDKMLERISHSQFFESNKIPMLPESEILEVPKIEGDILEIPKNIGA